MIIAAAVTVRAIRGSRLTSTRRPAQLSIHPSNVTLGVGPSLLQWNRVQIYRGATSQTRKPLFRKTHRAFSAWIICSIHRPWVSGIRRPARINLLTGSILSCFSHTYYQSFLAWEDQQFFRCKSVWGIARQTPR